MSLAVGGFNLHFFLVVLFHDPTASPSFWPTDIATWVDISAKAVAALALFIGGIWGLKTYREAQRLKASEILLKMEEEFRNILPTYATLEDLNSYALEFKPILNRLVEIQEFGDERFRQILLATPEAQALSQQERDELTWAIETRSKLGQNDIRALATMDRCLRFFYLCSVLNKDLAVENNALRRAYYYYVSLLVRPREPEQSKRPELNAYVCSYYPRLHRWLEENAESLRELREGKPWSRRSRLRRFFFQLRSRRFVKP